MERSTKLSRRATLGRLGGGVAAAIAAPALVVADRTAAQEATPPPAVPGATPVADYAVQPLPDAIQAILREPHYLNSRWGIHVADQASGEPIYDLRGNERFLAASTTKLFPTAAALHAYGPDFRFETPIYRQGDVVDGTLDGDLILVASGDPTMGGRTTPDGGIAFTAVDHIYANALGIATLTEENPIAGIHDLAAQVKAAGIDRVEGNVIVDDRLFPTFAKDDYVISPIWINDNLIDFTISPGAEGEGATVAWRPFFNFAYTLSTDVRTVAAGQPTTINISSPDDGEIEITGDVPADAGEVLRTFQIQDPAAFARNILIEELMRAGVEVTALPSSLNPWPFLPEPDSYTEADRVALLVSPPFAENIKLINKVSMNQHADLLVMLLALKAGETSFEAGLAQIRVFLEEIGLDPDLVSLSDGRGNVYTDLFSPRTVSQLLHLMTKQDDFAAYFDSLSILGVDGSETGTVAADSPVAGKARAKSGTTVDGDLMNDRPIIMTRAITGYMTAKSGRDLIFALYVNDVPVATLDDLFPILEQQGTMVELIYDQN